MHDRLIANFCKMVRIPSEFGEEAVLMRAVGQGCLRVYWAHE
jgi:hypothetical protein